MGIALFERWSPEYALHNTAKDIEKDGLDGLKKHLTANAVKTVEGFDSGISAIASAFAGDNPTTALLNKLSECEWTLKELMKGSTSSRAIVGFDYEDKLVGTVELKMVKEDKSWKIDGLSIPKFDKFDLSDEDEEEPAEA